MSCYVMLLVHFCSAGLDTTTRHILENTHTHSVMRCGAVQCRIFAQTWALLSARSHLPCGALQHGVSWVSYIQLLLQYCSTFSPFSFHSFSFMISTALHDSTQLNSKEIIHCADTVLLLPFSPSRHVCIYIYSTQHLTPENGFM